MLSRLCCGIDGARAATERLPCCCVDSTACDGDDGDDAAAVAAAVASAPTGGGKQRHRLALRVLNAQVAKMQREVRRQASTAIVGDASPLGASDGGGGGGESQRGKGYHPDAPPRPMARSREAALRFGDDGYESRQRRELRRRASLAVDDSAASDECSSEGWLSAPGRTEEDDFDDSDDESHDVRALIHATGASVGREALFGVKLLRDGTITLASDVAFTAKLLTFGVSPTSSTGFVTFYRATTAAMCLAMEISPRPLCLEATAAPECEDLIWSNVPRSKTESDVRQLTTTVGVISLLFLWTAAIQLCFTLSSLSTLKRLGWKTVDQLQPGSYGYEMLTTIVPVVLLSGLLVLLPFILQYISIRYEHVKLYSQVQDCVLKRYFAFQLVNVYLLITTGTLLNAFKEILHKPSVLLSLLSDSLPTVAVYFTTLLVLKAFVALPFELSRAFPLLESTVAKLCGCAPRTARYWREGVFAPLELRYGWIYPSLMLVMVICFVYAPIAPIVCPFGLVYFVGAAAVYRHQALYVYTPRAEAGGALWFGVVRHTLFGLACGNATLVSMLVFKYSFLAATVTAPLVAVPIVGSVFFDQVYGRKCSQITLARVIEMDRPARDSNACWACGRRDSDTERKASPTFARGFDADYFRQSMMKEGDRTPEPSQLDDRGLGYYDDEPDPNDPGADAERGGGRGVAEAPAPSMAPSPTTPLLRPRILEARAEPGDD